VTPVAKRQALDDETPKSVEAQSATRDEEVQALSLAAKRILKLGYLETGQGLFFGAGNVRVLNSQISHKACRVPERVLRTARHFSALASGRRLKAYLT
jgi:hypothetical protein